MIEFDCAIVVALHLRLIGVLQNFPCVRKGLLIHGPIVTTRGARCLRYGSPKRSESSPVLPDGSTGKYGAGNVRINAERLQFPASNRENKSLRFILTNPELKSTRKTDRMS